MLYSFIIKKSIVNLIVFTRFNCIFSGSVNYKEMFNNTYNFSLVQGASFSTYLLLQNNDGSVLNLSGYMCSGIVKNSYECTGIIYNLNPQIVNEASGMILVSGLQINTENLPVGNFAYDLFAFNNAGFSLRALNGDFIVYPSTSF